MDIPEGVLIDKLIHIRQNNEIMYRGLAPCTIVQGITDHDFRDIMDAAIYCLIHKDDAERKAAMDKMITLKRSCVHGSVCTQVCTMECEDFER